MTTSDVSQAIDFLGPVTNRTFMYDVCTKFQRFVREKLFKKPTISCQICSSQMSIVCAFRQIWWPMCFRKHLHGYFSVYLKGINRYLVTWNKSKPSRFRWTL